MAFIREYMNLGDEGDPFRFRIPKRLRKWKPGRTLKHFAPQLLNFVPGIGPVAAQALQFARGYGFDVGDPGGTNKRKVAGSGPKAKAAKKRAAKAKPVKMKKPSHGGKKREIDWGAIAEASSSLLPVGADLAREIMKQSGVRSGAEAMDEQAAMEAALQAGGAGMPRGMPRGARPRLPFGFGTGRRSMNVANVKALRRGIRRVEGFQRLVKSVYKAMPALRPGHGSVRSYRGGHRPGCRCVACKRK